MIKQWKCTGCKINISGEWTCLYCPKPYCGQKCFNKNWRNHRRRCNIYGNDWIKTPFKDKDGKEPYGKWNPHTVLLRMVKKYGCPHIYDRRGGDYGFARWVYLNKQPLTMENKVESLIIDKIVLQNQQILHKEPTPHLDFLRFYFKLVISKSEYISIMEISKSIGNDRLTVNGGDGIWVRCHFEGANWATIYNVIKYLRWIRGQQEEGEEEEEWNLKMAKDKYGSLIDSVAYWVDKKKAKETMKMYINYVARFFLYGEGKRRLIKN